MDGCFVFRQLIVILFALNAPEITSYPSVRGRLLFIITDQFMNEAGVGFLIDIQF